MRILVVDDESQIARVLRMALQAAGHQVVLAGNGEEGLERFQQDVPDLVITDLAMPIMDGLGLVRAIRRLTPPGKPPILVLSVRESETMKVAALDEGADDYLTKPFSTPELLARVRAHLRKSVPSVGPATFLEQGDFIIDIEAHTVQLRGADVHLTPKEFDLLVLLTRNVGRVVAHRTILREIWGPAAQDQPDYVRILIAQLRRKLEAPGMPRYIQSEPWVGYRLHPEGIPEPGPS